MLDLINECEDLFVLCNSIKIYSKVIDKELINIFKQFKMLEQEKPAIFREKMKLQAIKYVDGIVRELIQIQKDAKDLETKIKMSGVGVWKD